MRVALVGTNNRHSYSGGRYHAAILAYAMARAGIEVSFVTNNRPVFLPDLEPLAPGGVNHVLSPDFRTGLPAGDFDFVIVVPTGIFQPEFYGSARAFASRAKARLGLINFESANWFNALVSPGRDPRIWDNWRRIVTNGGLVLSSTAESERLARQFYRQARGILRFEVCPPPINSPVAERAAAANARMGSVLCFVRASDGHKGGHDLLAMEPTLFAGRTLHVVSGSDFDAGFRAELERRFGGEPEVALRLHSAVSDEEKFRLMAEAKALLFPSHFEGFGYPPVEAAYAGAEIACYDLPVLRETVGSVARMAPVGDTAALGRQLRAALDAPDRARTLRAAVEDRVGIDAASLRIADILIRSAEAMRPTRLATVAADWGPWPDEVEPEAAAPPGHDALYAPYPPHLSNLRVTQAGDMLASIIFCARAMPAHLVSPDPETAPVEPHFRALDVVDGWVVVGATCLFPPTAIGRRIALEARSAGDAPVAQFAFMVEAPERAEDGAVALREAGERWHATLAKPADADEIALTTDGVHWDRAPVADGQFALARPAADPEAQGVTLYVYRGDAAIAVFGGYPPNAMARRAGTVAARAATLAIAAVTDGSWHNGIARRPVDGMLGVVRCVPPAGGRIGAGAVVRFGSGLIARVAGVRESEEFLDLMFDEALDPEADGHPHDVAIVDGGESDERGEWTAADAGAAQGTCFIAGAQWRGRFSEGAVLRFGSDVRRVARIVDFGTSLAVWLDAPLAGYAGGAPEIVDRDGRSPCEFPVSGIDAAGWRHGVRVAGSPPGRVVRVLGDAPLAAGDAVVFAKSGLRRIVAVERAVDALDLTLDACVSPGDDGAPRALRLAEPRELAARGAGALRCPSHVFSRPVPLAQSAPNSYRRRGEAPAAENVPAAGRPRVLFASMVPPLPVDQGNRVVTKNFIAHLVNCGFDVDLLLLGSVTPDAIAAEFGDRVRVFSWPFPDWPAEKSAALRRRIAADIARTEFSDAEAAVAAAMREAAVSFHPYFIVPDAMADLAKALYAANDYRSVVCNYTHMLRIAEELAAIRPLPPVAVVTHDALSRLPTEFEGKPLDTTYRYCSAAVERAVLDGVKGATVLAISTAERDYFRAIGVANKVVLCEFDGLAECRGYRVPPKNFDAKQIVFHASANPMNVAGLDWFVERCWRQILARCPAARLVVVGRINSQWSTAAPNVEAKGSVARGELMQILNRASIAINPVSVGTGLKIKTVEAACMGLPAVGLPCSVDGLEDVAHLFSIVARDEAEFAAACIRLLEDREAWRALRESALAFTLERFSETAIYREVDAAMGWDKGADERLAATRAPAPPTPEGPASRAASRALASGDVALAIGCAARALAANPADLDAHRAMCAAVAELSSPIEMIAAAHEAALAAPLSAEVGEFTRLLRARLPEAPELSSEEPVFDVPLETEVAVPSLTSRGLSPGIGWSGIETWGVWSNGPYARLALAIPKTASALRIALTVHAIPGGIDNAQSFRLFADGRYLGRFELTRNFKQRKIEADLPAVEDGRDRVVLEFFIADPAPVANKDGVVVDGRRLGIALHRFSLTQVAQAALAPPPPPVAAAKPPPAAPQPAPSPAPAESSRRKIFPRNLFNRS